MNYEKICKLINGIIESELNNVQQFKEMNFSKNNQEQKSYEDKVRELFDKLNVSLTKEQQEILNKLNAAIIDEWVNLCGFYFKEGVAAGLTNLSFLNTIDSVGSYIE